MATNGAAQNIKASEGKLSKRKRLLGMLTGKGKSQVTKAPDVNELANLSREVQILWKEIEPLTVAVPKLKADYFAAKQAIFDKQTEDAKKILTQLKRSLHNAKAERVLEEDLVKMTHLKKIVKQDYATAVDRANKDKAEGQVFKNLMHRTTFKDAFKDITHGQYQSIEDIKSDSALNDSEKKSLIENFQAIEANKKVHELVAKFDIHEAEAVAIRIYSSQDYEYINPATANQQDREDRQDWMSEYIKSKGATTAGKIVFVESPFQQWGLDALQKSISEFKISPKLNRLLQDLIEIPGNPGIIKKNGIIDALQAGVREVEMSADKGSAQKELLAHLNSAQKTLIHILSNEKKRADIYAKSLALSSDQKDGKQSLRTEGAQHAAMAIEGIKKLPHEKVLTYRGLTLSPDDWERQIKKAKEYVFETITSLSLDESISRSFMIRSLSENPKHVGIMLIVQCHQARNIEPFAEKRAEKERVLLPGDRCKITKITPVNDGYAYMKVYVEQIV